MHVEWKNVGNWDPLPSNKPWVVTDVSERINPFPTNTLEDIPSNEPCKFQLRISAIISTLANWNLASFPIVGNGLAHSVGEAAFVNVYVVKTAGF